MQSDYKLLYTKTYHKNFDQIFYFLADIKKELAIKFREDLKQAFELLKTHPYMCVAISEFDTLSRRMHYEDYTISYRVDPKKSTITIVRIRHSSRKPIKSFNPELLLGSK